MLLTLNLSIHNRSKLFGRALMSHLIQSLPPKEWEIVLVDDMSTEDLSAVYKPYLGQINLRHVLMDHTRHPIFKERNPDWKPGSQAFQNWYHTPALSLNLGAYLARGRFLCVCHPEVIHAPNNFELACAALMANPNRYLFGKCYLGSIRTNAWLDDHPDWSTIDWQGMIRIINRPFPLVFWGPNELYWYLSFLPKEAFPKTGGVSFEWLHGAAAEDDCFRDQCRIAGYVPTHMAELEGIHQDHSDETEGHRLRETEFWQKGLKRNRSRYYEMRDGKIPYPVPANASYDWAARECFVKELDYTVGSRTPLIRETPE